MNKGIYIATMEEDSGKSLISLGFMQTLLGKTAKVGYFRPIIDNFEEGKKDNHIETILSHFEVEQSYESSYGVTRKEVEQKRNSGNEGDILDIIINKYKNLEDEFDFVLVEGTDFSVKGNVFEFETNISIAKNLALPTVIISSGRGKSQSELVGALNFAYTSFVNKDVKVIGVVANKVEEENINYVNFDLKRLFPEEVEIAVIPLIDTLLNPTVKEIVENLDGKVLFGSEYLNNQVGSFGVGAMQLRNYLTKLKDNSLVITPGDRAEIILGALQAHTSANYPNISGIVLTGGLIPEDSILRLIEGLSQIVPIISVKGGTFRVTNAIGNIKSQIYKDSQEKILTMLAVSQKHMNLDRLSEKLINFQTPTVTPKMFQYGLYKNAQKSRKHIVLPEGSDDRILLATMRLLALDIVDITLLGNIDKIKTKMNDMGINIDLKKVNVVNPVTSDKYEAYAKAFYELRKHKGVNMDMAHDIMADVSYFGTMMIHMGDADGMVSGAAHTTQHTIRPALQFIKTKPGVSVVSSVFFMCLEDRVSVFGDCAINPNPSAEELAEIAISSAESSKSFGVEPKVAMLSYSSGTSGKGEDVDKVRKATEIVREKRPDLKIEGPIQYDAAVDASVGRSKMPESEVAGQATVLIFPDLNTGNNTYKAVQRETGALAIGPMLQGLNKPVNDLSRGCTVDDVFNTVILTAIQAQGI